jgi:hypothetical protein
VANLKAGNQWQIYGEPIVPTRRGQPLSALPWFWLSFSGHTAQISKPPLLGMVNVALSHYRLGADYAHGLHWTGLPTFYVTGSSSDEAVKVGSATALVLADSAARVGFAEFKGDGLGSLERAMAAKERMLAILGAAVFGTDAKRIETAEAARIRNSGETSLLMGVVSAVQASLEAAMKFAADWQGAAGDVSVSLNTDFVSEKMDPQTLVGLVAAYQAGALTLSSLLAALQDGELLPPQTDIADEVAKLGGQADGGEGAQVGHPAGGKQPSDRGHRQTAKEFGITRRTVERAEKIAAE